MAKEQAKTTKQAAKEKKGIEAVKGKYIYAVGRRKTSTAKVRLHEGAGRVFVNNKEVEEYFNWEPWTKQTLQPLNVVGAEADFDVIAHVTGGGLSSQADAIAHGLARALVKKDEGYKKVLKSNDLLTRDPRMKERKKPGLRAARRRPQWSKR